ncbi:EndoIII-related endonuclease Nth [Methanonatronarchaeum thermophilum]|uniref:EndoIII-related endonuclease Nth n=1 Tax=Methanonatronarchaeum thermophilum TaxID=1927129 RepID=A0A1Y3GD91_9EURY|nr:endonuclease III [Methanonatronarchaeum thermophilum]OUJ19408.1 EndoIII-related endonuclease Nth [Methanonatronarchaeum thermophilum]
MQKLNTAMDRLEERYGQPDPKERNDPLLSLIQVILSQNTNDKNRDRAYRRLNKRFNSPKEIMNADKSEISEAISVAGLHNIKAERIQKSLKKIYMERGELNLDFLEQLTLKEAKKWLMNLPGIGPKSSAVILNFDFDKNAFPVDTHVYRVTQRLGLIPNKTNREKAHQILEKQVPSERMYEFHINLIKHGRTVCKARKPICSECSLTDICGYEPKNYEKSEK